jgi:16S rRNA (cytosine967-C5)-methyltransferase
MTTARRAAWRALLALETGRVTRIDAAFDVSGLAPPDRALAFELVHGAERGRLFLDAVIEALLKRGATRDHRLRVALRLGAHQILRLTRIPTYAAVSETVGLLHGARGTANAVLRRLAGCIATRPPDPRRARSEVALDESRTLVMPVEFLPDPETDPAAYHALLHGLPAFLVQRWEARYGAETARRLAAAADRTPAVILRATRPGGAARLQQELAAEEVQTEFLADPRLLRWTGGASPFGGAAYRAGAFVAQDPTALRAAEALDAQPGETIVDLCAGPGTKTVLLAERVGAAGRVHAYDVTERRRAPIRDNAARLGFGPIVVVHDDQERLPVADRVLADVPCSNTGVLARRVEARRRLTPESFAELAARQRELLARALRLARPGGVVAYSTCSIEPEENDDVVDAVVGSGARVRWRELTLPDPPAHDGGFVAVIDVG